MVSVIVPIYNVADYLPQCIDSICAQTYKNIEIILVDDGSTDSCPLICDRYADADERVKVIHKTNGGLVSARKAGLMAAHGEFVSCIDSDDWIEPDMIEKLMGMCCNTHADIIAFAGYEECEGYQGIKKNSMEEGLYQTKQQLERLYGKMLMNGTFFEHGISTSIWNKAFKKDVLEKHQMNVPDEVSYGEDTACVYPCMLSADSVYVTNMPMYHYRMRQGSITRGTKVGKENFRVLYQYLKACFDAYVQKDVLNMQLNYYMWQALLLKGYDWIHSDFALFPFEKVRVGMKVAVYGAGLFGQVIREHCQKSNNLTMAGWFDRRYEAYAAQGMEVKSGDDVIHADFDVMVIAVLNTALAQQIKNDYVSRGIPENKIDLINKETLDMHALPVWC